MDAAFAADEYRFGIRCAVSRTVSMSITCLLTRFRTVQQWPARVGLSWRANGAA
jgi:hypothetical protein